MTQDYKSWLEQSPLEFKKRLVSGFLDKTIEYALEHIQMRALELPGKFPKELSGIKNTDITEIQRRSRRLEAWTTYIEFQEHSKTELQGDKINAFIP